MFIDTTGWAFTFPVARLFAGCKVAAYVHYPTISSDMLKFVRFVLSDVMSTSRALLNIHGVDREIA